MFSKKLAALTRTLKQPNEWIFTAYDQLSDKIGPLSCDSESGVVLIEDRLSMSKRPYHKQKIALMIANMRHFALEQARKGRFVHYLVSDQPTADELEKFSAKHGNIKVMEPAEYELRTELERKSLKSLEIVKHEGWLTSISDLDRSHRGKDKWRMDRFYRYVRKRTGILMTDDGKPIGGKYSFDADNRKPWSGKPEAPRVPTFPEDEIKLEVRSIIEKYFSAHPGEVSLDSLPATQKEALQLWNWSIDNCLENFGTYEDAMSVSSSGLFHTRISALLNIHRLLPAEVLKDVLDLDIPLNSKEGFVRQVLGWREFVRLIHIKTDGFRYLDGINSNISDQPGDGGFENWSGRKWSRKATGDGLADGGASPSFLGASNDIPPAFWGKKSGLHCLDTVVEDVWKEGYSHHITRLMILANIATLLDVNPRQLTDWFWIAYTDAYDWVVEPNVLAMGTHAVGDCMTTKPYISGANYINKMSDYCSNCKFDPRSNCPITSLYWSFLERHKDKLEDNRRLFMPLNSLKRRSKEKTNHDKKVMDWVLTSLSKGHKLELSNYPE